MAGCVFEFVGILSKETVNKLVVELLKHILYYQGQFPLPFEQVKSILCCSKDKIRGENNDKENVVGNFSESRNSFVSEIVIDGSTSCEDMFQKEDPPVVNGCRKSNPRNQKSSSFYQNKSQKKLSQTLAAFELLFEHLFTLLQDVSVSEVVLHLGHTLMSPKETFLIKLPSTCKRTDCSRNSLPYRHCMMQLFRTITKNQQLLAECSVKSLVPIVIMMCVPCDTTIKEHMELKSFYKIPTRGKIRLFHFRSMVCNHQCNDAELLSTSSSSMNSLLGFNNESSLGLSESMDELALNECQVSCEKKENMWILLKPVLKGFKDNFTSKTSEEDIWM